MKKQERRSLRPSGYNRLLYLETYICNQLVICFFCEVSVWAATIKNYLFPAASPSIKTQWDASIIYSHDLCLIKISGIIKLKQLKTYDNGAQVNATQYIELMHTAELFSRELCHVWLAAFVRRAYYSMVCLPFHCFMGHLAREKYENFKRSRQNWTIIEFNVHLWILIVKALS